MKDRFVKIGIFAIIILLAIIGLFLFQLVSGKAGEDTNTEIFGVRKIKNRLIGEWRKTESQYCEISNVGFYKDGTIVLDEFAGKFKILDDNTLKISGNGKTFPADFAVKDEKLTLTIGNNRYCIYQRTHGN